MIQLQSMDFLSFEGHSTLWVFYFFFLIGIHDRYRKKVSLYNERVEELNMVTQERDDTKKQYDEWRKKRQIIAPPIFLMKLVHKCCFHQPIWL